MPPTTRKDFVFCGAGNDTVYVEDTDPTRDQLDSCETVIQMPPQQSVDDAAPSVVRGGPGNDTLYGTEANDSIFGSDGNDELFGNGGDDYVDGENGDDILHGGPGNDKLYGRFGNDTIAGNEGDDQIEGGYGDDVIDGGPGNDTISGTQGSDSVAGRRRRRPHRRGRRRGRPHLLRQRQRRRLRRSAGRDRPRLRGCPALMAAWTPPVPIAGSVPGQAQVVYTQDGRGLAGGRPPATLRRHGVSRAPCSARCVRSLPLTLASLVTYGSDRVAAFGTTGSRHPHAAVSFGTPGGPVRRVAATRARRNSFVIAAAADAKGDAAALLRVCESDTRCSHAAPYLVVRRAGRAFGHAIKLDHGPTVGGDVALDARGDVLVAWERPVHGSTGTRGIYDRIVTAGGHDAGTQRLRTVTPSVRISVALPQLKTPYVAWDAQAVSEGDATTPATLGLNRSTLATIDVKGTGRYVTAPAIEVKPPYVAWTGYQGGRFVVFAEKLGGKPAIVSDPSVDTVLGGLAVGPDGAVAVLGRAGIRGNDPVGPVSLVASTDLGPPVTIARWRVLCRCARRRVRRSDAGRRLERPVDSSWRPR